MTANVVGTATLEGLAGMWVPTAAAIGATATVSGTLTLQGLALPEIIYGFAVVATGDSAGVGSAQGGATVTASDRRSTAVSMTGPSARVSIR